LKLQEILRKAAAGERVSPEEARHLYHRADLLELGSAARGRSGDLHGGGPTTFLIDRNINYTNVCENRCRFCAFYRDADSGDAFLLSTEEILRRVEEAVRCGATQIMLQGGLHPDLDLDWFVALFSRIRPRYPVHLHSLSPPEVFYLAQKASLTVTETLQRLMDAGLGSLPGGGAEILVDEVRARISPRKIGTRPWVGVMKAAHRLGLPTTATMMFGTGETFEERLAHLETLRNIQDLRGGFLSFIPWTFQADNTELSSKGATTLDYLRTLALSRLFLDNFKNIQGSWVTQGPEIGQISLDFGANDLGSIMLEENVVKAAGTSHRLSRRKMVDLIRATGRSCAQRDTLFNIIECCGTS
jgi:cyclic dehypoxanthinyl futalosine synthase